MTEEKLFTITVNSMNHNEWQGWVKFSTSEEKYCFQSLPELARMVAQKLSSASLDNNKNDKIEK